MSILRSLARHSSAFDLADPARNIIGSLREALLDARRGTVTHSATIMGVIRNQRPKYSHSHVSTRTVSQARGL